jgi:hypothetical protein
MLQERLVLHCLKLSKELAADSTALARAIRMLLANREVAGEMARAGKVQVEQEFASEAKVRQLTDMYDEVLASHQGGGQELSAPAVT